MAVHHLEARPPSPVPEPQEFPLLEGQQVLVTSQDENLTRLVSWFLENGGYIHPAAEILSYEGGGHYLRVRTDQAARVQRGQVIVSCPPSLMLSSRNLCSEKWWQVPKRFGNSLKTPLGLRLFLMKQYIQGKDSFWWPYIGALPQPFSKDSLNTPLYFDDEDMLWVEGTEVGKAAKSRVSVWKKEFEALKNLNLEFAGSQSDLWTRHLYLWAATIISSRCFPGSSIPDLSFKEVPVLIPGVDLLNHSPDAEVDWYCGSEKFAITTNQLVASGDEIFNNYGEWKTNAELLMGYGFCLEDNLADSFDVDFSPSMLDRIGLAARARTVNQKTDDEDSDWEDTDYEDSVPFPFPDKHWIIFGRGQAFFSPNFLEGCCLALSIRRETELVTYSEVASLNIGITADPQSEELAHLTGTRIKLSVLGFIIMILQSRRKNIRKHDKDLPSKPQNKKQEYAAIYRSAQLKILESTLVALSTRLQSFMQMKYLSTDLPRVIRLADILTGLPKMVTKSFREVIHAGLGTRDPKKVTKLHGEEFVFSMWLLALWRITGRRGEARALDDTEPVLAQWIRWLESYYNLDDLVFDYKARHNIVGADWLRVCDGYAHMSLTTFAEGMAEEDPLAYLDSEASPEIIRTAVSYRKAIMAAIAAHPDNDYAEMPGLSTVLLWILLVVREERVTIPKIANDGALRDVEEEEVVLAIDELKAL